MDTIELVRSPLQSFMFFQVINDLLDPAGQNLRIREDTQVHVLVETEFFFRIKVQVKGPLYEPMYLHLQKLNKMGFFNNLQFANA